MTELEKVKKKRGTRTEQREEEIKICTRLAGSLPLFKLSSAKGRSGLAGKNKVGEGFSLRSVRGQKTWSLEGSHG